MPKSSESAQPLPNSSWERAHHAPTDSPQYLEIYTAAPIPRGRCILVNEKLE